MAGAHSVSAIQPGSKGIFSTASHGLAFRTRRRPKKGPTAETRRQMASLAEHVAEGGSINAWAALAGVSTSRARQIWGRIKAAVGTQAV
jgi:hypothetical protein